MSGACFRFVRAFFGRALEECLTGRDSCIIDSYMSRDSRLSGVLHVLLHMAERRAPQTSEALAETMRTNPVVVRRVLAGLRERGYVQSSKGHGGGWTIARDLADVSLRDIYEAIGSPPLFAIGHRNEAPGCAVELAVNAVLGASLREAEERLLASFDAVTLADLSTAFNLGLAQRAAGPAAGADHEH